MTEPNALVRFLQTDPRDPGCAETMELLHVYTELAASGQDPEQIYPGITAHLRTCGPCFEDFEGLLAALAGSGTGPDAGGGSPSGADGPTAS